MNKNEDALFRTNQHFFEYVKRRKQRDIEQQHLANKSHCSVTLTSSAHQTGITLNITEERCLIICCHSGASIKRMWHWIKHLYERTFCPRLAAESNLIRPLHRNEIAILISRCNEMSAGSWRHCRGAFLAGWHVRCERVDMYREVFRFGKRLFTMAPCRFK